MTLEYIPQDELPPCPRCDTRSLWQHITGNEYDLHCSICHWYSGWQHPRTDMNLAASIVALVTTERRRIAKREAVIMHLMRDEYEAALATLRAENAALVEMTPERIEALRYALDCADTHICDYDGDLARLDILRQLLAELSAGEEPTNVDN